MSVEATNWARRTTVGNPTAKAVLCAIANYADAAGISWPSQAMLCGDTELSERAVRNAIQLLKDRGLLTSEKRHRTDGSRKSDRLILSMAVDANRSDVPVGQSGQAANRHDVPVGGDQPAPDAGWVDGGATNRHDMPEGAIQPAPDAGSPTGTSCRTNRHVVPGSLRLNHH